MHEDATSTEPSKNPGFLLEWRTAEGGLVVDVRFAPIVICTWYGPNTYEKIDRYFEWSQRFLAEVVRRRTKVVFISDLLDAHHPDAKVRRYVAERLESHHTAEHDAQVMATIVVVRSAFVRGAMTAISWFSSRPLDMVPAEDMPTAFEHAGRVLEAHGLAFPPSLDVEAYRRPVPHEHRGGGR